MFSKNCQKAVGLAKTFAKAAWTTDTIECCLDVQVGCFAHSRQQVSLKVLNRPFLLSRNLKSVLKEMFFSIFSITNYVWVLWNES